MVDNFSFTNPPEMNDLNTTLPSPSIDFFQLVMTFAMLEIGINDFYEKIDGDKLNRNYNNFYWR